MNDIVKATSDYVKEGNSLNFYLWFNKFGQFEKCLQYASK